MIGYEQLQQVNARSFEQHGLEEFKTNLRSIIRFAEVAIERKLKFLSLDSTDDSIRAEQYEEIEEVQGVIESLQHDTDLLDVVLDVADQDGFNAGVESARNEAKSAEDEAYAEASSLTWLAAIAVVKELPSTTSTEVAIERMEREAMI
tara:strand:+ start:9571 stop:10014 length:444 start_codon:yes stop_codon:yes gene_type:complete